mmetsp:Transcript_129645/g.276542  ORF Transcript_129645/g.276542 Transcript_129645/m.276542 type:complete len:913 (-) Transcript_129645:160-2898(-)
MLSAVLASVLDFGWSAGFSLLATIAEVIRETWTEVLVVAVTLHIYIYFARTKSWLPSGSRRQKKVAQPSTKQLSKQRRSAAGEPAGEAAEVQRLVVSLLRWGNKCDPAVLEQYEALVQERHVDLRKHITEEEHARTLYVGLIGCGLRGATGSSGRARTSALLADMRAFGYSRDRDFYSAIVKLQVHIGFPGDVLWLHDLMAGEGIIPDRSMYICFLNVAVSRDATDKAEFFFKKLSKLGPVCMRTYMTMLRIYAKKQDWRGAVALLDGMKAANTCPDALVLNTVMGLCISASEVVPAERSIKEWQECADVVSYNTLLKGYMQRVELPKAEAVLQRMLESGPAPNVITFNTLMDTAVRALNSRMLLDQRGGRSQGRRDATPANQASTAALTTLARRPWQLLDQLIELDLEPDRYTCSTLAKGMHLGGCSSSDIDRLVTVLRRIGVEGLATSAVGAVRSVDASGKCNSRLLEVLFNTLLDTCVTLHDLDRMADVFRMMEEFEVTVSAVTFGTLIKAFGQAGQLEHCHEAWSRMEAAKVTPTIVTFGCYIDACLRSEDVEAAERVMGKMRAAGLQPNSVIYTSLIRGMAQAKKPLKAMEIYTEMRKEGCEATAVTYNSLLDVIVHQLPNSGWLEEVMNDMTSANIAPDVVTYSILIKASCLTGQVKSAITFFRRLRSHGLPFDEVSFNTLLIACSKAEMIVEAEEILADMESLGVARTDVTTCILVKMYGKAKMLDKAISVSGVLEEFGRTPNLFVYTSLIQACVQNKQVRESWEIFHRMLRSGVSPDAVTFGSVIHSCIFCSKFEQAMALVRYAYILPVKSDAQPKEAKQWGPLEASIAELEGLPALTRPVPLQSEVLRALLGALRRKAMGSLADELEAIMAESREHQSSVAEKAGKRSSRPRNPANPRIWGDV